MNIRSRIENVKFPKALADLKHANQFLKVFALALSILSFAALSLAVVLITRGPNVITLTPSGAVLGIDEAPNPEKEVEAALRKYISLRYTWTPKSVKEKLGEARQFVHQNSLRSFDTDLLAVQKFATDRNVSQRGYVSEIRVDLEKQTAHVRGDRVTTIQDLTAAGELILVLQFESGPRTKTNPWGIYVGRERNE